MAHPFDALIESDPIRIQRQELLDSGVAPRTIEALYPERGFNAFLALVTDRLRHIGIDHTPAFKRELKERGTHIANDLMRQLSHEVGKQWDVEWATWDQRASEVNDFIALLKPVLTGASRPLNGSGGPWCTLSNSATICGRRAKFRRAG
jgi:hypothetical protein